MFGNFNIPGFNNRPIFPNGAPSGNNPPAFTPQPAFAGGAARDEFVPSFAHSGPPAGLAAHIISQVGKQPIANFKKDIHFSTWEGLTNPPAGPHGYPIVEGY